MKSSAHRACKRRCHLSLGVFLACAAAAGAQSNYAGWAVGDVWDGHGTIIRSTDSGNTWTRQGAGQIANVGLSGVWAVDPWTAWVVGPPDGGYATIYHTTDGGATWVRKGSANAGSPDYVPNIELGKVHAAGDEVWIVGYGGTVLHTSDGGATWVNRSPAGYEDVQLQGVYALDGNTVWATGNTMDGYATILKSTDAGMSWTRQSGGDVTNVVNNLLAISAVDADTAWAVGGNGFDVLKTIDGGETWTRDPHFGGSYDMNDVHAVSASTVWVAHDFNICWSTNGGTAWATGSDHGLGGGFAFMGISAVSDLEAWGSHVAPDSTGFVCHTTDGGLTWTTVGQIGGEQLPDLWKISFAPQPIPEPTAPVLLCLSVVGLGRYRHRRRK